MAEFAVAGPYKIPFDWRPGGRLLFPNAFWQQSEELEQLQWERGCYVFAMKAGKGATPLYVGQATRSFKQECFSPANIRKCLDALATYAKRSPVIYLVRHPPQRGKTNSKQIGEIESFLIQNASIKNPDIQNVHGKEAPKWSIQGVVRGGQGKPSKAATQFRRLIGINK